MLCSKHMRQETVPASQISSTYRAITRIDFLWLFFDAFFTSVFLVRSPFQIFNNAFQPAAEFLLVLL